MSINPAEIELTEGQRRYVATRAERTGMPWPEFLHGLVPEESEIENGEMTAYDLAQKMGIIGMSDDGPGDLATNPAHMEGFGQHDYKPCID